MREQTNSYSDQLIIQLTALSLKIVYWTVKSQWWRHDGLMDHIGLKININK